MRSELLKLLVKIEMIWLEFFQLNVFEHKNAINLYCVCFVCFWGALINIKLLCVPQWNYFLNQKFNENILGRT